MILSIIPERAGRAVLRRAVLIAIMFAAAGADDVQRRLERGEVVVHRNAAEPGILSGTSQVIIPASVDRVWAVLMDHDRFDEFMPRYLVSDMIGSDIINRCRAGGWVRAEIESAAASRAGGWAGDTGYVYNVLDMPFPVADRWYLLKLVRSVPGHTIRWDMLAGNMRKNYGLWTLEPVGAGRTLATYTTCSDPGISMPGFVLDIGLNSTLPGVVAALRKRVLAAE